VRPPFDRASSKFKKNKKEVLLKLLKFFLLL